MFRLAPIPRRTLRLVPSSLLVTLLATMTACGPDGHNAGDNPTTGPVKGTSSTSGGVIGTPVASIGSTVELAGTSAGSVDANYQAVVASNNDVIVVWTQSNGTQTNLLSKRFSGGSWSAAEALETGNGTVSPSFKLLIDGNNNITVIWAQEKTLGNGVDDLFATRYDGVFQTWGAPTQLDSDAGMSTVGALNAAADSVGNVTVVWSQLQNSDSRYHMYARRASAAGVWAASAQLDDNTQHNVETPKLALDSANNLNVIWRQRDNTDARFDLYANRYNGAAWSGFTKLSNGAGGDVGGETIVVDSAGNVTVAWKQSDGNSPPTFNLWYRRYVAGWQALPPQLNTLEASIPRLELGAANKVFIFWNEYNGSHNDLKAQELSVPGVVTTVDDQTADAGLQDVVVDGVGNITAVWSQSSGGKNDLWARRYLNASGWEAVGSIAQLSNTAPLGDATNAHAHVDSAGNVEVYWMQDADVAGMVDLWANRYLAGVGWQGQTTVEDLNTGSVNQPISVLESAATGNIDVLWQQIDSTGDQHLLVNHHNAVSWFGVRRIDKVYGAVDPNGGRNAKMYVDSAGTVTVFWLQPMNASSQGQTTDYLLSNRFSSASW